jgi:hypothetical protein
LTDDKVILKVVPGLPPYINSTALAEGLYPGVAVSVQTATKDGSWAVNSFILSASSVSVEKGEDGRKLLIGLDSLPDSYGETEHSGFVIKVNENYVVEEINSDTEVDVIEIKVRLFGPSSDPNFLKSDSSN